MTEALFNGISWNIFQDVPKLLNNIILYNNMMACFSEFRVLNVVMWTGKKN